MQQIASLFLLWALLATTTQASCAVEPSETIIFTFVNVDAVATPFLYSWNAPGLSFPAQPPFYSACSNFCVSDVITVEPLETLFFPVPVGVTVTMQFNCVGNSAETCSVAQLSCTEKPTSAPTTSPTFFPTKNPTSQPQLLLEIQPRSQPLDTLRVNQQWHQHLFPIAI